MTVVGNNRRRRRAPSAAETLASPLATGSVFPSPSPLIPSSSPAAANSSIANIRLAFNSRLDSLRKDADLMHATLLKEVTTASSRLSKRLKLELQACTQHIDDFERDCDAFSTDFKEDMDEIKGDYEDFISKAQNSSSQYLRKTLPDFMNKVEKDLEKLRTRFATSS
ncbi:hypothetical protein GOP47_0019499 [Adiantum capillus-veneris]|uniref:Uncharacterized protein n=1 Tax=Adiantum capillus-veneris TaxID=13818 RepID=A0A9D4UB61_ADICA|nr:hypothetical protein GOP47_0019499 [Adiantum capillus-veneris]